METGASLPPAVDFWTILFFLAAGQGVFFALLLGFSKRKPRLPNMLLSIFIFLFALTLFEYVLHWTRYMPQLPHMLTIYKPFIFLYGPLLLLYVCKTERSHQLRRLAWLHFIPFFIYLLNRLPFYFNSASNKALIFTRQFDQLENYKAPFFKFFNWEPILFMTHLTIYAIWIFTVVRQQRLRLQQQSNEAEQVIRMRWYQSLAWLFAGFVLANVSYYILVKTSFFHIGWDYGISLAMTLFIYTVGYLGFRQPEIFNKTMHSKVFLPSKYKHSSLTASAANSLRQSLLDYMDSAKPHLNNELRLEQLAEPLHTTRHHLSQLINEQFGKTFSAFINDYRVRNAQQLLADEDKKDEYIINIAYASGFNNKTSFYTAFKKRTGLSPKMYRKQILNTEQAAASPNRQ